VAAPWSGGGASTGRGSPAANHGVVVVLGTDVIAHVTDGEAVDLGDVVAVLSHPQDDSRGAVRLGLFDDALHVGLKASIATAILATVAPQKVDSVEREPALVVLEYVSVRADEDTDGGTGSESHVFSKGWWYIASEARDAF
jgi:hypothetical protein